MLVSVLFRSATIPCSARPSCCFRLFDIWKPVPARQLQSCTGPRVMLDDLIAVAYALALIVISRALLDLPYDSPSA